MKRKTSALALILVFLFSAVAGALNITNVGVADSVVDNWPMFHHDLTHSGYSTSTAPLTNNSLWKYQTGDFVDSSPAVVDGVVYIGSGDNNVYALNASTGSKIWSYQTGFFVVSSPAVAAGVVYVGSCDGNFYALNSSTGNRIWSFQTGKEIRSSPVVYDQIVYFGTLNGADYSNVYALDAVTGNKIWNYSLRSSFFSSPSVAGGIVYIASTNGNVSALDASSGQLVWEYHTADPLYSSPAVDGGVVYICSGDGFGLKRGNVLALDALTGTKIWSYNPSSYVPSSPAVANGLVYASAGNGNVFALDATSGSILWSTSIATPNNGTVYNMLSSPAVAAGVLYIGSFDQDIYALDASDGHVIWSYATVTTAYTSGTISSPAIVDGVVYIGAYDGNVYALGGSPTPTPSPSPQPSASFIQTLINSASPGDTIHVPAGTYVGHVNVNKPVKLVGEHSALTIIDGGFIGDVVEVSADNVEISGFTIQNSGPRGIGVNIEYHAGSKIHDNIIKNNYEGIVVGGSSNTSVYENEVISNFGNLGVMINYSTSVTFSRNFVRKNVGQGLVVFHCSNCLILENQIVENDDKTVVWSVGMVLSNSYNVKIVGNNITANADHGLNLVGSRDNEIYGNIINKNDDGICLTGGRSTNNNIYQNTLQDNGNGFEFYQSPNNNSIYHNNIIGNDGQVYDSETEQNKWDSGYPSGGNYWSDYFGNDTNNDGIGDTPYVIDEDNQDNYPFMTQINMSYVIPPSPSPSPSPTPTPTPTATPQPTATPTPTITPTPSPTKATPTLDFSCKGTAISPTEFKVEITGELSYNGVAISGEAVLILYSVTGGDEWESLTLVNTGSDGSFIAVWMPCVPGNYLVKAVWEGNSKFNETSTIVNFALKAYSEESVFSLTSNSTITEFAFNSTSKELSFTASGPFGTTGYVNVYIPKSLASDISDLKVYVDGYPITYSSESQLDSWIVSFTYSHSTHNIAIDLSAPSSETIGSVTEFIYVIAAVAIALAITAIVSIRKDLKGKTVREA
jgi:parallel beta-helix repeat protein